VRVLTDFHHAGLLHSLIMLFEDRLGAEIYRPIGMEWAEQGFWAVYDHPATQQQYLTLNQAYKPIDWSPPLNTVLEQPEEGIYYCQDIDSGYYNKAITLEKFKNTEFDIVIASMPQHIEPYQRLIAMYNPKAKLIFQVGNQWDGIFAQNIMASAKLVNMPESINYVEYHQEFDLNLFKPIKDNPYKVNIITSFMNIPDQFPDYPKLLEIEQLLGADWAVNIHGGMGRDGPLHGAKQVAEAMAVSRFVWHVKAGGDGYGHVLFNTAACGVPTIVNKRYYNGKLGEKLLIDGVTCIDIDGLFPAAIVEKINHYSDPVIYEAMCKAVYKNFLENVDFKQDEKNIREFLKKLK
jgi:hypothetical protein